MTHNKKLLYLLWMLLGVPLIGVTAGTLLAFAVVWILSLLISISDQQAHILVLVSGAIGILGGLVAGLEACIRHRKWLLGKTESFETQKEGQVKK